MNSLKKQFSSLKGKEFKEIYNSGTKIVTPYFVIFLKKASEFKVGVIASKKIGNAVKRNKAKRRLREIVRLSQLDISRNLWIVLIARKPVLAANFNEMKTLFIQKVNNVSKDKQNNR